MTGDSGSEVDINFGTGEIEGSFYTDKVCI